MPYLKIKYSFSILFICFVFHFQMWSQINFCPGNTGEAIFEEDFGQGVTNGPPLGTEVTSYTFVNQAPQDGQYTISSNLMQLDGFHNISDNTGNQNGKALIVNADFDAGLFYQISIDGLCENNSYEFSAYLVNLYNASTNFCPGSGIPVNVRFQIWDETDTTLLAEGDTGDIPGSFNSPSWQLYGVTFETLPGQTSVILKMLNNGNGGCGNDLAIDDIVFKSCGDLTEIFDENNENTIRLCENESIEQLSLSAIPDFSVYDTHFYQWQQSEDSVNWINIEGETSEALNLMNVSQSQFYRALVAEDIVNVNNTLCNSISNVFEVRSIAVIPPVSLGDVEVCEGEETTLAVQNNAAIQVDWYDEATGGNLLLADSFTFDTNINGTYYAQSTTVDGDCVNPNRVPINVSISPTPETESEFYEICPGETITLNAETSDVEYVWSTDETTPQITVSEAGVYSVERITAQGCSSIKEFQVEVSEVAEIQEVFSQGTQIIVQLQNEGDFLFSLEGGNFQSSNTFNNISGGRYTIEIRSANCGSQFITHNHLVIPKYFSPNNDGFNDVFRIPADRFFEQFSIQIFDQYGKLLVAANQAPFVWDGTYNGKLLPSQDFWYKVSINNQIYVGNITLVR